MNRRLPLLFLLLVLAIMVGCVSPRRLFNLTPLSGINSDSRKSVNLWPLYYGSEDGISVLWPIFDADKEGFALRPLLFKEGKEWGILWPVSDFDEEYFRLLTFLKTQYRGFGLIPLFWIDKHDDFDKGFYQFLLGYKLNTDWGVFPLLHHGDGYGYCFPLYYFNSNKKTFFSPVCYFSPTRNFFTLAWWNHDNGDFGFFPLLRVGKESRHFLLWWKSANSTGLFPLYIYSDDFSAIGPVWWTKAGKGVFPFCYFGEKKSYCLTWWKGENSTGLLPIYLKSKDFTAAGPVWWKKNSRGVFPLFSHHSSDWKRRFDILYHLVGGYEERLPHIAKPDLNSSLYYDRYYSYDWLCYLGKFEVLQYNSDLCHDFRMWPLFSYTFNMSIYPKNMANKSLRHSALCSLLWESKHSSHYQWTGEQANDCRELFECIKMAHLAIDLNEQSVEKVSDMTAFKHLLIQSKCQLLGLEPPSQWTHDSLDALVNALVRKYPCSLIKSHHVGLLLDMIDYERFTNGNTSFELLWGALYRHDSSPNMTVNSFLWRGFRQVTTPTETSRDIFPFISYYHDQKDNTTVTSFGWRLFRRETSPAGNKLWLFFIPFQ